MESGLLRPFLNSPCKEDNFNKRTYFTVEKIIKELSKTAPAFLDLDELLEYFSIKGPKKGNIFFEFDIGEE